MVVVALVAIEIWPVRVPCVRNNAIRAKAQAMTREQMLEQALREMVEAAKASFGDDYGEYMGYEQEAMDKARAALAAPRDNLNYSGGGRISVPVDSIVSSSKVQRQVDGVRKIAERAAPRETANLLTDAEIMSIVIRETDTLDCTRVSEMTPSGWKATTIFDGDDALLRCIRAALAAAPAEEEKG